MPTKPNGVGTFKEVFIDIIMPSAKTNFVCLYDIIIISVNNLDCNSNL